MRLWVAENRLAHHLQVVGSTGTGKSCIARQLARQAEERGWPIIFTDLKREHLSEFYVEGRDYLIDFGDQRGCRWMLSRETEDESEGFAIAEGAFPDEPTSQFFFTDSARALLAYLLGRHRPSTSGLASWMADPREIDRRVVGTEHAVTLDPGSMEQRNGVLGTLNHLGRSLRWMPDEEGRREFCVADWAKKRDGHIFLSSTPKTFSALRPMQSMILDMLLLAMMSTPGPGMVILDEVGVFQRLPQLERAVAMQRGSGNPIVLIYQGIAQMRHHYGEQMAESITTNPYTNIVLRTSAGAPSEHASKLLGMPAQVERIRESRPSGFMQFNKGQYNSELVMDAPVIPGEIQDAEDFEGWISCAGKIVPIKIDYVPPIIRNAKLIKRLIPSIGAPVFSAADFEILKQQVRAKRNNSKYSKVNPAQAKLPLAPAAV